MPNLTPSCFLRDCQTAKCTFPCNLPSSNLAQRKFRLVVATTEWLHTSFSQGKQCSSHGGLITYIDTNINAFVEITSPTLEGLFVKIHGMENTKDIIISNTYRLSYDKNCKENINFFTSEISPILFSFDTNTNDLIVTGLVGLDLFNDDTCPTEHISRPTQVGSLTVYNLWQFISDRRIRLLVKIPLCKSRESSQRGSSKR